MEREPLTPFVVEAERVEQLADRLVRAGWRRVTEDPEPNAWRIEVTVPLRLPADQHQELFDTVCSAVEGWEPAPSHRDGWDADVAAHAIYDELLSDDGGAAVLRGGAHG